MSENPFTAVAESKRLPRGDRDLTLQEWLKYHLKLRRRTLFAANGCYIWLGFLNNKGYGCFGVDYRHEYVHRVAYSIYIGRIPAGRELDHLCRNTRCWNPDHLEPVTPRINKLRGISPFAKKAKQTHCIHGHPLEGFNLMLNANGTRKCRTCHYMRIYRRRQK